MDRARKTICIDYMDYLEMTTKIRKLESELATLRPQLIDALAELGKPSVTSADSPTTKPQREGH